MTLSRTQRILPVLLIALLLAGTAGAQSPKTEGTPPQNRTAADLFNEADKYLETKYVSWGL